MSIEVIPYADGSHRGEVVALWKGVFGYETAHNDPHLSIDRKLAAVDELFFVALSGATVVGTIMAGYDGHRGWIYSVAVAPSHRHQGIGSLLVGHAERALARKGCVKINLQILEGNDGTVEFYETLGFAVEPRISMGKRIAENIRKG